MRPTLALLAATVLLLTGCAAGADTPTSTAADTVASATTAPLVAETPELDGTEAETAFLETVRDMLPAKTQIPNATDEQLLAAGWESCERLAAGESGDTISVIEGEHLNEAGLYLDSRALITAAAMTIC